MSNRDIFSYLCSNIDCWHSLEPPRIHPAGDVLCILVEPGKVVP